jgi:hypothetical protein
MFKGFSTFRLPLTRAISLISSPSGNENGSDSMKYWEIIADNLSKAVGVGGCVSAVDSNGRTIFVADAHRGDGQRFIVRANEKLTAFVELEAAVERLRKNIQPPAIARSAEAGRLQ